jgi:hypothetical protein
MTQSNEQKKKQDAAASSTTVGSVAGEVVDTVTDILIIDSLVDLVGEVVSGILD